MPVGALKTGIGINTTGIIADTKYVPVKASDTTCISCFEDSKVVKFLLEGSTMKRDRRDFSKVIFCKLEVNGGPSI